jgi:hypothetical protein
VGIPVFVRGQHRTWSMRRWPGKTSCSSGLAMTLYNIINVYAHVYSTV